MPRTGGVYSPPAGTKGTAGTTIQSSRHNALVDDLTADANAARPITAGGTGATNATAARTALGLTPGTDVQAYDALLQSIAGLTTVADQIIYTTGTDVAATSTLTAFGRSLIDDASAAAARTTLGLGTSSVKNVGTSGDAVPLLNGNNAHSGANTFSGDMSISGKGSVSGEFTFSQNIRLNSPGTTGIAFYTNNGSLKGLVSVGDDREFYTRLYNASGSEVSNIHMNSSGVVDLSGYLTVASGGTGAKTAADARTNLGLGALATKGSVNDSDWSGADLSIANGGTGASTAAAARSNLGVGAVGTLNSYVSGQQPITNGGSLSIAHNLGGTPVIVQAYLVCVNGISEGYSTGDIVCLSPAVDSDGSGGRGVSVNFNDITNINVRFGASGLSILNKSTGGWSVIANTNWRFIVRVFA